jgi:hypothetical protein
VEKYGTARQATDDSMIRRMRFACWITNATNTHSEYVILIDFPQQQWLRERASVLRYTYISCLVDKSLRLAVGRLRHVPLTNLLQYQIKSESMRQCFLARNHVRSTERANKTDNVRDYDTAQRVRT